MISFKEALRTKDFVVTVELPLTPATGPNDLLTDAKQLAGMVDGFLITDYRYGQPHVSPLAAVNILKTEGLDPIMQVNCRDRNIIALIGELLGAKSMGIESLMLVSRTISCLFST